MKTKIFAMAAILMVVMSTIGVAVAQSEDDSTRKEIKGKRLLHRYNVVFRQAEQSRIGMEAVIAYVDESGSDSTGLVGIKDNFVAKVADLKVAAEADDSDAFKTGTEDIRGLIKEFKDESRSALGTDVGEARTKVAKAIQDNREYLDSLVEDINKARGELEKEAIDEAVEEAEEKSEKAKDRGTDTAEVQAKLEEIKQMRADLKTKIEAAVASCGDTGLRACDTPEAQEYKALKEEIKDEFKNLKEIARATGRKNKITKGIEAATKVLGKADERLTKAEERGADVTAARAKLEEVERILDSALEKYEAGDYEGAIDDLTAARKAFATTFREIKDIKEPDSQNKGRGRGQGRGRGGDETDAGDHEDDEHEEDEHTDDEEHEDEVEEEHEEETSTEDHEDGDSEEAHEEDETTEEQSEDDEHDESDEETPTANQTSTDVATSSGGGGDATEGEEQSDDGDSTTEDDESGSESAEAGEQPTSGGGGEGSDETTDNQTDAEE